MGRNLPTHFCFLIPWSNKSTKFQYWKILPGQNYHVYCIFEQKNIVSIILNVQLVKNKLLKFITFSEDRRRQLLEDAKFFLTFTVLLLNFGKTKNWMWQNLVKITIWHSGCLDSKKNISTIDAPPGVPGVSKNLFFTNETVFLLR